MNHNILIILLTLMTTSCAKVGYLWDQSIGQMSLLYKGKDNEEILKDPKTEPEVRRKIELIEKYKSYFYDYWSMEPTGIYSETTLLEGDAVTYLVIASPFNEIKAKEHCFPFMGCFPYLGFFSQEKAKDFAKGLEDEHWQTYVRPVYAYSTLGYFEDKILSSFFHYSDDSLAELIFHELFHTLFFIKDEVDLNEALASYFGRQMALEYFRYSEKEIEIKEARERKQGLITRRFVELIRSLNENYKKKKFSEPKRAQKYREDFIEKTLLPEMKKYCAEIASDSCFPLSRKWNNASMAAFMTYEDRGDAIKGLHGELGVDLKGFFQHIKDRYKAYSKESREQSFSDTLFKK